MKRLLVIEDDVDIRELVAFKLTQVGYEVEAFEDPREAVEAALHQPPDLVVLDIMMPAMSGLEVCRRLRAEPATAVTPIVMLTAKAQEADVERGFAAGATDYVVKPFSPRELVSRVDAILSRAA
ncbi:MAG TPA: response regulator [Acidimicrobiia bacterium]|nr:response regulator [Acidimicrobiia bacterium]